jgi:valyl-tRNA synthetase
MAKQGLYSDDETLKETSRSVVQKALMAVLRFAHPIMPFITEEIWQKLPGVQGSIMYAPFPEPREFLQDERALDEMTTLMGVITGIRNIRGEMNIEPGKRVNVIVEMPDQQEADVIRANLDHVRNLAKVDSIELASTIPKPEASATAVFGNNQVHVLLKGLIDFGEEKRRLQKEIGKIEKEKSGAEKKLSNRGFLEKAPVDIVEKVREKVAVLNSKLDKLNKNLQFFESIRDEP